MRHFLLPFAVLWCFSPLQAQYEEVFYSVTASAGLTLRAGPGENEAEIGRIPFNTQVRLLPSDPEGAVRDTINEVAGEWVPVRYQRCEGYVFSAYLKPGYLFTPAAVDVNQDYRIVIPGPRTSALNYDPRLNWYALVAKTSEVRPAFRLTAVEPDVRVEPLPYDEHYNWDNAPGLVDIDVDRGDDYVALLIGTRRPVANVEHLEQRTYFYDQRFYPDWGRVVHPFEQLELFAFGAHRYTLSAHVRAEPSAEKTAGRPAYAIGMSKNSPVGAYYAVPDQWLTAELEADAQSALSVSYRPRVFWQGDLNGDAMPDLIFYLPNERSEGGMEAYFLLLSEREAATGEWRWIKQAFDVLGAIGV